MNDYQKDRFVKRVVSSVFNTISGKKIAALGFGNFDPRVSKDQIMRDLAMDSVEWDHPIHLQRHRVISPSTMQQVRIVKDAYEAMEDAHGICVLTQLASH